MQPFTGNDDYGGQNNWKWYLPAFSVGFLLVTVIAFRVLRNDNRRWREATAPKMPIDEDIGRESEANLVPASCKDRSDDIQFPLRSVDREQKDAVTEDVDEVAYNYEFIGSPTSFNESEELIIQRAQLMKEYVMPVALRGLDEKWNGDDSSHNSRSIVL